MTRLTVALDMMGGDQGPSVTIPAAALAVEKHDFLHLILCGQQATLNSQLQKLGIAEHPRLTIRHCEEIVAMDEKPAHAIRNKKDSSMRVAMDLVQSGEADACVSAGNTGALLAIAHFVLKTIPGVERPALVSALPTEDPDKHVFMLDLGANVFSDSDILFQFALMGAVMAEEVRAVQNPRVALLNMGEEDIKGSDHIKHAAALLQHCDAVNYVGFVEGNDIFSGKADVIVCDGFVGNVALKTCEGVAQLVFDRIKKELSSGKFSKFISYLFLPTVKKLYKRLNPDQYNGASLLGLRGIVVKSHGNANVDAFYNAILAAVTEVERQVPEKIKSKLELGLLQRP